MPGQGGHADVEHFEDMTDAQFAFGKFLDYLQPRRMTECLKDFRFLLNEQLF